jgi:hypothetical protein
MRFRHRIDGTERLAGRLVALAELPGLDGAVDAAARRLARETADVLTDAYGPLDPSEAGVEVEGGLAMTRQVVLSGRLAFEAEFGSRRRGAAAVVSRAARAGARAVGQSVARGARAALRAVTGPAGGERGR